MASTFAARDRIEVGIAALDGIEMLLGSIYRSGQDLHCLAPNDLAMLLALVRKEIAAGLAALPR